MITNTIREKINEIRLKHNRNLILFNANNFLALNRVYRIAKIMESNLSYRDFYYKEQEIRDFIYQVEFLFSDQYLIPYQPRFNPNFHYRNINWHDATSILDYIVNEARRQLKIEYGIENINLADIPTANQCYNSSLWVSSICANMSIKHRLYKINAGYSLNDDIYNGSGYHYVVFAKVNNKKYLIDTTYAQFFTAKWNTLDRLGLCNVQNCLPGRYMIMNKERLLVAKKILRDGWIELTSDTFKHYLDGFTLSYRNGLYYERNNDFSYETPYTAKDYLSFLEGKDNQVKREGRELLGFQYEPLHDPYLDFSKRK